SPSGSQVMPRKAKQDRQPKNKYNSSLSLYSLTFERRACNVSPPGPAPRAAGGGSRRGPAAELLRRPPLAADGAGQGGGIELKSAGGTIPPAGCIRSNCRICQANSHFFRAVRP